MTNIDLSTIITSILFDTSNVLRIGSHLGISCYATCYIASCGACKVESRFIIFGNDGSKDEKFTIYNVTTFFNNAFTRCQLYRLSKESEPATRFLVTFMPTMVKGRVVHAVIINWTPPYGPVIV